jgi:anti-sigma B factor antagonist
MCEHRGTFMALEIQTRRSGDLTVVVLSGRLTVGEAANSAHEYIEQLVAEGARNVVIDLRNLAYIDSAGLGALVSSLTSIRHHGGNLSLANVPKRIQDLLDVSSLYMVFQIIELAEQTGMDQAKAQE